MRQRLISIDISCISFSECARKLCNLAANKKSSYACLANVHMLVESYRHPDFAKIINEADMVTPDGMPLTKSLNFLYGIKQERVAGMDLLPRLLTEAERRKIKVSFYGGTQKMLQRTISYCESNYPTLEIVEAISPPFRILTQEEEENYIQQINNSGAGFVFVALGCPKQEKWMASMKGKINSCMIGIGGALPVMIGMQKRASTWMQKSSLEWSYRLFQEPRRLFKRYAITNSMFVYLLFKEWLKSKMRS